MEKVNELFVLASHVALIRDETDNDNNRQSLSIDMSDLRTGRPVTL